MIGTNRFSPLFALGASLFLSLLSSISFLFLLCECTEHVWKVEQDIPVEYLLEWKHYHAEGYEDDNRLNRDIIWNILKCDDLFLKERPIHSEMEWTRAIDIYSSITKESPMLNSSKNGFNVLVEAKQSPGKGRGIFAGQTIRKGEIVWSTKRTARFDNAGDYIEFLFELDPSFACDVLQWAYVQDVSKDGEVPNLKISVDLDEGSFCNDASDENGHNMGCDPNLASQVDGGCQSNYFALRDIQMGEELLCDYSSFAVSHGWRDFGL
mmetsp:Transcript_988/g.1740  ORF Transcript_988/g.1740 Transcript_988/m.1740 type:complete len:266 (-) Transcript_988:833-1630(-)